MSSSNNRCKQCNTRNLLYLNCSKCNNKYCTKHLLPELHFCTKLDIFRKEAYEKNAKSVLEAVKREKPEWVGN